MPSTVPSTEPARRAIKPRRLGLRYEGSLPRYWYDGDPLVTHFLNVLSMSFPDGEKFFVDSVRFYRDRVTDERQREDVAGFVGQEMQHSLEHDKLNRHLAEQGYGAICDDAIGFARRLLSGARKKMAPEDQLGATAALEHVTAVLASSLLSDPETLAAFEPTMRTLWTWHAVEELEHKAVAYDLFEQIGGTPARRKRLLVLGTAYFLSFSARYTWRMLEHDGLHRRPDVIARGMWRLWGPRGMLTRAIPEYVAFFRDDFHPWQQDHRALLDASRAALERMQAA